MSLRPPRPSPRPQSQNPLSGLEYELLQEQATALGRLGRRLEAALAALAAFDAAPQGRNVERAALLDAASESLWLFLVQREACGLRDSARVMRDYGVPIDVQVRIGAAR